MDRLELRLADVEKELKGVKDIGGKWALEELEGLDAEEEEGLRLEGDVEDAAPTTS